MKAKLIDKLTSIPQNEIVAELDAMLDRATVDISWWGRVVSIEGYEGSVPLNQFTRTYFKASAFNMSQKPSYLERSKCYWLGQRFKKIYKDSETELSKTVIYKYLLPSTSSDLNDLCGMTIKLVV